MRGILKSIGYVAISAFAITTLAVANTTTHATHATKAKTLRGNWPAGDISGTIAAVYPDKRLVIVRDSSGVPFDFIVEPSTHIASLKGPLKLADLASRTNTNVSIRFVPERMGDVAESISLRQ